MEEGEERGRRGKGVGGGVEERNGCRGGGAEGNGCRGRVGEGNGFRGGEWV